MAVRTYDPRNPLTQYLLRLKTILPEKGPTLKKRRPRKNNKKYLGLWGGDLEAPALKNRKFKFLITMPPGLEKKFIFI